MPNEPQEPLETDLKAGPEAPEPEVDPQELQSVKDVLAQLTKTAKTIKLYLPNNPIYQKFLQDLYHRLVTHLDQYKDVELRIKQYEMFYHGMVVYENMTSLESLAFKFFVDGLRQLTISEGLELEELKEFIEIISRKYDPDDPDDDIVTLLWDRRLPHIKYLISEDFIQETPGTPMSENPDGFEELVRNETKTAVPETVDTTTVVQQTLGIKLRDQDLSSIFVLTEEEVAKIRHEMSREEDINPVSVLLNILLEIIKIDQTDKGFEETAVLIDSVYETLLSRGDLNYAIRVLQSYHELLKSDAEMTEPRRQTLRRSLEKAGSAERVQAFGAILDRTDKIDSDQILSFCFLLGQNAVIPLVDLMGKEERAKVRRTLCEGLIQICKNNIDPLLKGLRDPRWFVVRNVLYILGRIGKPDCLERIRPLVSNKEVRVRKELIHTLDGMKDDKAKEILVLLAEDPDPAVRAQAVRSLGAAQYGPALDPLLHMVQQKSFLSRDLPEKKEWFKALGQIGGNAMIPLFQRILVRGIRAWFQRAAREEMALVAIEGLRRIGTEEAEGILLTGQRTSRKRIREACMRAVGNRKRESHGG